MACEAAISNPLLDDVSIKGAKGVLVNMTGGPDMTLFEADMAVNAIKREVDPNANIIFGSAFNEDMKGKIRISVVATGIDSEEFRRDNFISNFEPTRFKVEKEVEEIKHEKEEVAEAGYFDPGVSAALEEVEIEEVSDLNFKPKKSYTKEENIDYGKVVETRENKVSTKSETSEFAQSNFFSTKDDEEEIAEKQKKKPIKAKTKKETSGFSLFSFMNSSPDKSQAESANDVDEESDSLSNDFLVAKKTEERQQEAKSQEAEKKRRQFFSETIFDEDSESKDVKFEDDILNVPAFFRRKK